MDPEEFLVYLKFLISIIFTTGRVNNNKKLPTSECLIKQRWIIKTYSPPERTFYPREVQLGGYPHILELQAMLAKTAQSKFKDRCRTVKMDLKLAFCVLTVIKNIISVAINCHPNWLSNNLRTGTPFYDRNNCKKTVYHYL